MHFFHFILFHTLRAKPSWISTKPVYEPVNTPKSTPFHKSRTITLVAIHRVNSQPDKS